MNPADDWLSTALLKVAHAASRTASSCMQALSAPRWGSRLASFSKQLILHPPPPNVQRENIPDTKANLVSNTLFPCVISVAASSANAAFFLQRLLKEKFPNQWPSVHDVCKSATRFFYNSLP